MAERGSPRSGEAALPVAEILDELGRALRGGRRAVLQAPAGSGKTTLVPPWLLASGLVTAGEIVVLQPRKVAARAVARRLARAFGEEPGGVVGYQVRLDTRVSARTRIRVVTEGVLTAWLQRDPELRGVAAVVLDELHERSLDADLALALCREVQAALRDDLLLVAMSATLDAEGVAAYLGGCPVVSSDGRLYPVTVEHAERPVSGEPVADAVARGVLALLDGAGVDGDVLAFLPGVRDIEAARLLLARPLEARGRDLDVLHGRLPPEQQDAVLDPGPRPRVVLATNIAETSLTLGRVGAVVDSGLHKVMRYEPSLGAGRLYTERVSRASADQRAGRAGRLGPGRALRLWTAHEDRLLSAHGEPEITRVELTRLALELRGWGVRDLGAFELLTPAPAAALAHAEALLTRIGACDASGSLTALGERLRRIPAHPRVASFLVAATDAGEGDLAARMAAALELGREAERLAPEADLVHGARRLERAGGHVERLVSQLAHAARSGTGEGPRRRRAGEGGGGALEAALLHGFSDRVGVRREAGSEQYKLAGGRGARVIDGARAGDVIVALELDAGRRGAGSTSLVRRWASIDEAVLRAHPRFVDGEVVRWDELRGRVVAERVARFDDLVLEARPVPLTDRVAAAALLYERAAADPEGALGTLDEATEGLLARLQTLGRTFPELALAPGRRPWLTAALPALCEGRAALEELRSGAVAEAVLGALPWEVRRRLDAELPERIPIPSGRSARLTYDPEGSPVLAVKIQELYGQSATPTVASGRLPVVLHLLSPAGRPLQVTRDLAGFWARTWPAVRGEMRSRYPKHDWPEDPLAATPSQRTIKRR